MTYTAPLTPQGTLSAGDTPAAVLSSQTANFNAAVNHTYMCDTTSNTIAAYLPDATTVPGRGLVIYLMTHTDTLTITPLGSQTINGSSTLTLTSAHTGYALLSDGTNWQALSGLACP